MIAVETGEQTQSVVEHIISRQPLLLHRCISSFIRSALHSSDRLGDKSGSSRSAGSIASIPSSFGRGLNQGRQCAVIRYMAEGWMRAFGRRMAGAKREAGPGMSGLDGARNGSDTAADLPRLE